MSSISKTNEDHSWMATAARYAATLGAVAAAGALLWPSPWGAVIPVLLFIVGWLGTTGPSFARSPRHPDINAVLDTPAMRAVLLRPIWTPRRATRFWQVVMVLVAAVPGFLIGIWPLLFTPSQDVALRDVLWWTFVTPLILAALSFALEALLQQTVATPLIGLTIFAILIGAPIAGGESSKAIFGWESRVCVSIMLGGCTLASLWLTDMMRLMTPNSERNSWLRHRR